jgi:GNAT superfamily N-acetyltransferase
MDLTIRRATAADAPMLVTLNAFVHELHVTNNPAYFKPGLPDGVAAWFRGLLEKPTTWIWIAEPFSRSRRWVELDQMGVRPDNRRNGLARALVDMVVEASKAADIRDVELSCWVFNAGAQEAFRRLGFTPRVVRFVLDSGEQ